MGEFGWYLKDVNFCPCLLIQNMCISNLQSRIIVGNLVIVTVTLEHLLVILSVIL